MSMMFIIVVITDIDECVDKTLCAHGTCNNTVGGFVCTCYDGFTPSVNRMKCLGKLFLIFFRWAPIYLVFCIVEVS